MDIRHHLNGIGANRLLLYPRGHSEGHGEFFKVKVMKRLFLTSDGTNVKGEILKFLSKNPHQLNLLYIITASIPERDKWYLDKDREVLVKMGFKITKVDVSEKSKSELIKLLAASDVAFVQGGNTFYLLNEFKKTGFDKLLKRAINTGMYYIGVSAGTIICSPTIEVAGWKSLDNNIVGLKDLTALNLVPFNIFVHYTPKFKKLVKSMAPKSKFPTKILTDNQAISVIGDRYQLVGKEKEIQIS